MYVLREEVDRKVYNRVLDRGRGTRLRLRILQSLHPLVAPILTAARSEATAIASFLSSLGRIIGSLPEDGPITELTLDYLRQCEKGYINVGNLYRQECESLRAVRDGMQHEAQSSFATFKLFLPYLMRRDLYVGTAKIYFSEVLLRIDNENGDRRNREEEYKECRDGIFELCRSTAESGPGLSGAMGYDVPTLERFLKVVESVY